MITDAHFHADLLPQKKLEEIQENKRIKFVVTNSVNIKSIQKNFEISEKFSKIKLAVGLYPEKNLREKDFEKFVKFVRENKNKIVALGEIGLDLYEEKENFEIQKKVFLKILELAKNTKLPVIIHSRKAEKEVLEIIEKFPSVKVVLHCFSGNFKLVKKGIELGCFFSIPANIVRSEHFQKMAGEIPREKILTETDSPYLSPFREKENEPAFINESIKKISEIWKIPRDKVEKIITGNFETFFGKLN